MEKNVIKKLELPYEEPKIFILFSKLLNLCILLIFVVFAKEYMFGGKQNASDVLCLPFA